MHVYVRRTNFTTKPRFEIAKELSRCCSPIGQNNTKHFFLPIREPPFAWSFGNGLASVDTQGPFRLCLKRSSRLSSRPARPDCPWISEDNWCCVSNTIRMLWVISGKEKLPTSADKQNRWCNRILTRAAVKLRSHGNPAVPTSWVDADVNGFEWPDKLMINYGMTICVPVEYLRKN